MFYKFQGFYPQVRVIILSHFRKHFIIPFSRLYLLLEAFNLFPVAEISSSISQGQRQKVLEDLKSGRTQVLVCSDQMARGMDVEGVSCVVNYEPPRQFRIYLHRAGRTARVGKKGVVYTHDEV